MAEENIVFLPQRAKMRIVECVPSQVLDGGGGQNWDNVIIRKDISFWVKSSRNYLPAERVEAQPVIIARLEKLSCRTDSIHRALVDEKLNDVIMQSARFSLEARDIGLVKTAKLAVDIGEAAMHGQILVCAQLINKLEGIVSALVEDLQQEAQ